MNSECSELFINVSCDLTILNTSSVIFSFKQLHEVAHNIIVVNVRCENAMLLGAPVRYGMVY